MKLIFAADDYEDVVITRTEMKSCHDVNFLMQIDEIGTYFINFSRKEACFQKEISLEFYSGNKVEIEFDEENLIPHSVWEDARHHHCLIWTPRTVVKEEVPRWRFDVDYFNGIIGNHNHDPKIREVYLSVEAPFIGKVCGYGEKHSSADIFPNGEGKMVAVKVIPNTD